MKHILVVGTSYQSAKNLARDILESRGEQNMVTRDLADRIDTSAASYLCLPQFHATKEPVHLGRDYDEVHVIADIRVEDLETVRKVTGPARATKQAEIEVHIANPIGRAKGDF